MNKEICYKKLDENDILEILIEHFQNDELLDFISAQGCLLGKPGENLRFIGVFSNDECPMGEQDFEKIDKELDYNGDHSFLKSHPEFNLAPQKESTSKDSTSVDLKL